jgi:elongation factor P
VVGDGAKWLRENVDGTLVFYKGKAVRFDPPAFVELEVARSEPGVQGDRSSGATKPATLESGATIQVPLFVNEGDVVKVDTRTGEYIERVSF